MSDVYKDLGHYGMHHICIWVDDVAAVKEEFEQAGIEAAMEMVSSQACPSSILMRASSWEASSR